MEYRPIEFYYPMEFEFYQNNGLYLPLIAIEFQHVNLQIKFVNIDSLVYRFDTNIMHENMRYDSSIFNKRIQYTYDDDNNDNDNTNNISILDVD